MSSEPQPGVACTQLILPFKPFWFFCSIWGEIGRGMYRALPAYLNNNRCPKDTITESTYEVLYFHHGVQLRNRPPRSPNVGLRHGPPGQKTGPYLHQE